MSDHWPSGEPRWLNPSKVGATVVACPGCGEQRWYGYGACGRCGTYLPSEPCPCDHSNPLKADMCGTCGLVYADESGPDLLGDLERSLNEHLGPKEDV